MKIIKIGMDKERMTKHAELILLRERCRKLQINLELEFKAYSKLFDWVNERYPDELGEFLNDAQLAEHLPPTL